MVWKRTAGLGLVLSALPAFAQAPAAKLGKIVPLDAPPVVQPAALTQVQGTNPTNPTNPMLPPPRTTTGPGVTEIRNPQPTPGITQPPGVVYPHGGMLGGHVPVPGAVYPVPYGVGQPGVVVDPGVPVVVNPAVPSVVDEGAVAGPVLVDPYLGPGSPLFPRVRNVLLGGGTPLGGRLSLEADYLLWFLKAQTAPPLVTTSSPQFNGIIGQGDTRVLFGGDGVLGNTRFSGGRFGGTYWFRNSKWGVDGNIFFLGVNGGNFTTNSFENPLLARPFVRADTGAQFSELVAFPGLANGSVAVEFGTEMLGADVNFRRPIFCGCNSRLDFLIGYRNVSLLESLQITEAFARTPDGIQGGNTNIASGTVQDRFRTENRFHGVNLGLAGELRRGRFFAGFRGSVGLGSVYQSLEVNGSQRLVTTTGAIQNAEGGLLALPNANIGMYTQRRYGFAPEANLTLGVYLTPNLRFGVGYNFLYLNSVLRPADQIDTVVDLTRIPNFPVTPTPNAVNPARPRALPLRTTEIYATGITFSLQWTW